MKLEALLILLLKKSRFFLLSKFSCNFILLAGFSSFWLIQERTLEDASDSTLIHERIHGDESTEMEDMTLIRHDVPSTPTNGILHCFTFLPF